MLLCATGEARHLRFKKDENLLLINLKLQQNVNLRSLQCVRIFAYLRYLIESAEELVECLHEIRSGKLLRQRREVDDIRIKNATQSIKYTFCNFRIL